MRVNLRRGGSSVAVALYATAGLVSEHIRRFFQDHLSWAGAHGVSPLSREHGSAGFAD